MTNAGTGQTAGQLTGHPGELMNPQQLWGGAAKRYMEKNPDVAAASQGKDPTQAALEHFGHFGQAEGRQGFGLPGGFGAEAYKAANPDVAASGADPWEHWKLYGKNEGRQLAPYSKETKAYFDANKDVADAYKTTALPYGVDPNAFAENQYENFGIKEGRYSHGLSPTAEQMGANAGNAWGTPKLSDVRAERPEADIFGQNYMNANTDVRDSGMDALAHYITFGKKEGREGFGLEEFSNPDPFGGQEGQPGSKHEWTPQPETTKPYTFGRPAGDAVTKAINETYQPTGLTAPEWAAIAQIESTMNPTSNQNNADTQYKGLYQLGSRATDPEWATWGMGDIYDARDNADTAARLFQHNRERFKNWSGNPTHREPTAGELYLIHNQGLGFFTNNALTSKGNIPDQPEFRGHPVTHDSILSDYTRYIARMVRESYSK